MKLLIKNWIRNLLGLMLLFITAVKCCCSINTPNIFKLYAISTEKDGSEIIDPEKKTLENDEKYLDADFDYFTLSTPISISNVLGIVFIASHPPKTVPTPPPNFL